MKKKIRVILVDDHQVLLDGLRYLLKDAPDLEVVAEAHNGQQLLELLANQPRAADLILMDIDMPIMDGITATGKVKKNYRHLKVIMLTTKDSYTALDQSAIQGADGFISKKRGRKAIIDAIRQVCYNNEFVIQANLNKPTNDSSTPRSLRQPHLTLREKQILRLLGRQFPLDKIASSLALSTPALSTQLKVLFAKLQVDSAEDALQQVLKLGILSADDFS